MRFAYALLSCVLSGVIFSSLNKRFSFCEKLSSSMSLKKYYIVITVGVIVLDMIVEGFLVGIHAPTLASDIFYGMLIGLFGTLLLSAKPKEPPKDED